MGRITSWVREHWFVLVCMAVAAVVAIAVRDQVFPHYGPNRDEPVYVLQAQALKAGHLTLPRYDDLRFFQPWLTGVVDGRVIFEFPPGWPAFLAVVSLLTGSMVPALPIVAALVVLGMYLLAREASGRRDVASVAAAVMVLTPMMVIQSGQLISYLFTLALGCSAGTALLRGARSGRASSLAVGGALLGLIFLSRPFDALLWGIPFGVFVLVCARGADGVGATVVRGLGRAGWMLVGFLPPALVMLGFNLAVTGHPTKFPIEAADPLNSFGFGERRIMRGTQSVAYSRHDALDALGHNFRHAPPWVLGSWAGVALALVGVYVARRRGSTYVLLGLVATFGVGYLFYWGLDLMAEGAIFVGPQYYLPMVAPVVVLGATTLVAAWQWHRFVAVGVAAILMAISAPWVVDRLDVNRDFATGRFALVWDALAGFDEPNSLVFVPAVPDPYILSYVAFAENSPALDGARVYAVDLAPDLVDLVAKTDRTPFRLANEYVNGPDGQVNTVVIRRLRVTQSGAFVVSARITSPATASLVTAYLETPGGTQSRVLDEAAAPGATYDLEWTVGAPAHAGPGVTTLPTGVGWLTIGVRFDSVGAHPDPKNNRSPDALGVQELRYATRTTDDTVTAVVPPRRYGLVGSGYGPIMLETRADGSLRGRLVPGA